jgi:hypothetical protein
MASPEAVENVLAIVWMKFPTRKPREPKAVEFLRGVWSKAWKNIPDGILADAAERWAIETAKLFPEDDPFAAIHAMTRPKAAETQGDFIELCLEAVSSFGWMREDEGMTWLEKRSPLAAATLRRFGYRQLCETPVDDMAIARGQMRAYFAEERDRANRIGGVVATAQGFQGGAIPEARSAGGGLKSLGDVAKGALIALKSRFESI